MPCSASLWAVARPKPLEPPRITAQLPVANCVLIGPPFRRRAAGPAGCARATRSRKLAREGEAAAPVLLVPARCGTTLESAPMVTASHFSVNATGGRVSRRASQRTRAGGREAQKIYAAFTGAELEGARPCRSSHTRRSDCAQAPSADSDVQIGPPVSIERETRADLLAHLGLALLLRELRGLRGDPDRLVEAARRGVGGRRACRASWHRTSRRRAPGLPRARPPPRAGGSGDRRWSRASRPARCADPARPARDAARHEGAALRPPGRSSRRTERARVRPCGTLRVVGRSSRARL